MLDQLLHEWLESSVVLLAYLITTLAAQRLRDRAQRHSLRPPAPPRATETSTASPNIESNDHDTP